MKKRAVSIIICLLLMCFLSPVSSSERFNWIYSSDTYGMYFDNEAAYYSKPEIIDFVIKRVYSEEGKKNLNPFYYGEGCSYILIHYQIDIRNREMQHIGSVSYNDAAEVVKSVGGHGGFRPVQPVSPKLEVHEGAEEWALIFEYVQKSMSNKQFHQIAYEDMFLAGITVMQSDVDDVKLKMGNPQVIEPLMIEGKYDNETLLYKYPETTYFIDSKHGNRVIYISTKNPLVTTKRGIRVGDDITKLVFAYGSPDFIDKQNKRYYYHGPSANYRNNLIFVLDAQGVKVARIIISAMP